MTGAEPSRIATLVLAAGRGERMGGPKALLLLDGEPLAVAHARARMGAESDKVIIVARRSIVDALARFTHLAAARVVLVASEEPEEYGPAGSIRAAAWSGALDDVRIVVVTPVDVMPTSARIVRKLVDAVAGSGAEGGRTGVGETKARAARFERGHPVACSQELLLERYGRSSQVVVGQGPPALRDVLASLGPAERRLPLTAGDPNLSMGLDTPQDFIRLTGAAPRFWSQA